VGRKGASKYRGLTLERVLRDSLRAALNDWDGRLERKADGVRAGLLESLPNAHALRRRGRGGPIGNGLRKRG
jgi:hypothetical protein